MGSLFRSEEMALVQLFLQSEAAYACVAELGELGLVQFRDLNPDVNAFQRKYVNEVRRCDEMERKLRYIEKEVTSSSIKIHDVGEHVSAPAPRELIDLEAKLDKLESELREVNSNQEALKRNYLELEEQMNILHNTQSFFHIGDHQATFADDQQLVGETGSPHAVASIQALGCLSGVINRDRLPAFEQMLWRVSRGNIFLRHNEIERPLADPTTGDDVYKCVFVLFFQGEQLGIRARKICEGFRASLYPCPEDITERKELTTGIQTRIQDLQMVLNQTYDHRQRLLVETATTLQVWFIKVNKMKAIYHTLNLFNMDAKCLIAECWCPVDDLEAIRRALRHGTESSGASVPSILNRVDTPLQPPTCNKTNKFTCVFQDIIDAYGVASYREVNPAPYAIITFPFLFAVMFGDAGHGLVMAIFGLWLVLNERKLIQAYGNDEVFGIILGGRYIIFLMGMFSIYTGLIYNDVFAKSLKFFDSSWNVSGMNFTESDLKANASYFLNPQNTTNGVPYPFGMDPIWQVSGNKISWLNSYKMKMSIIVGISQMVFGVILSVFNYVHFKKFSNLLFDFLPQIIFLLFIFGYMVVLIVVKWFLYSADISESAPSLIITIINMFLFHNEDTLMMYEHQYEVQVALVVLALLCIPWMLLARPIYQLLSHRARVKERLSTCRGRDEDAEVIINDDVLQAETEMGDLTQSGSLMMEENFEFGEALIYQGIHTIEYCLGCISHTASYLRLWALSLAHAELSEVLWTMVMKQGLSVNSLLGSLMLFAVFAFWAVMTVCILLLMEALSAFLHTLRLHWVEFQSKFYKGEGHPFKPFSFQELTAEHQHE